MNSQPMGLAVNHRRLLADVGPWQTYEAARQVLLTNLSRAKPADRYTIVRKVGVKC